MRNLVVALLVAAISLAACMTETDMASEVREDTFEVHVDLMVDGASRSSVSPDENKVEDINLYLFSEGMLRGYVYADGSEDLILNLAAGVRYRMYALANVGMVEPVGADEDFMRQYSYSIPSVDSLDGRLPMAASVGDVCVDGAGQRVCVVLERLVSKMTLRVDKTALEGLQVTSVKLCQSALKVVPFCEDGSAASDPDEVGDGDYCVAEDLEVLNAGGRIYFYALENCQGVLLPDNRDSWEKIPSALDGKASLCTYLEICCRFDGSGLYEGDVVYRLFLGQDNCSDFNVRRNTVLDLSLLLTDDGLDSGIVWKVTSGHSVRDGFAVGWISKGMHGETGLYAGERFEYSLALSEQLLRHIDSDYQRCEVFFRPFGEDSEGISFSEIMSGEAGLPYVEAVCTRPSSGEICLREKQGRILAVLSGKVAISAPCLRVAGEGSSCTINGAGTVRNVYLVDADSRNLNVPDGCGFDLSVFDFDLKPVLSAPDAISGSLELKGQTGVSGSGGPALKYSLVCRNDGSSRAVNLGLIDACLDRTVLSWEVRERTCSLCSAASTYLDHYPIELTIVDNGWAGYGSAECAAVVDNPSNLPFEVDCWQLHTTSPGGDQAAADAAGKVVENELDLFHIEYIVNEYNESSSPVYGSSASFVCERNVYGSDALQKGDLLVYNLEGIDSEDIKTAVTADGLVQESLSHHIDIRFVDGRPVENVVLNDNLAGNDLYYVSKYSSRDLNDRGIWICRGGKRILGPDDTFDGTPGLTPANIRSMLEQNMTVCQLEYNENTGHICAYAHSLGNEGLTVSSFCSASAEGYVKTYPDGTWGKAQDNWCSASTSGSTEAFPVLHDAEGVSADSGVVYAAFDHIYSNVFFDSWNKVGSSNSYMHSAHPVSAKVSMSFKVADPNDESAYVFSANLPIYLFYMHPQDGVRYTVPTEFSRNLFKFTEVTRL